MRLRHERFPPSEKLFLAVLGLGLSGQPPTRLGVPQFDGTGRVRKGPAEFFQVDNPPNTGAPPFRVFFKPLQSWIISRANLIAARQFFGRWFERMLFALACDFFNRIVSAVDRMTIEPWIIWNLAEQLPGAEAAVLRPLIHAKIAGGDKRRGQWFAGSCKRIQSGLISNISGV
jgi:hypothetical protein